MDLGNTEQKTKREIRNDRDQNTAQHLNTLGQSIGPRDNGTKAREAA